MYNKKRIKKALIMSLSAAMVFAVSISAYASTQALPDGRIISQDGGKYLADSQGNKYSGWFIDADGDWFYFNESDQTMKTGWHHDNKDNYWYYLNLADGKMVTGWQTIDGKEYFFQPVRDMGNYHFNNEQEKWLYSQNSKVPYGAMYVDTTTPDGSKVDSTGAKVINTSQSKTSEKTGNTEKNGWISQNGKWYYYESGVLAKNKWLNLGGTWYYVTGDGSMVSNSWKEIDGKSYYFGSDGAMYANTTTPDGSNVDGTGARTAVAVDNQKYIGKYIGDYYAGRWFNRIITIDDCDKDGVIKGTFYEEWSENNGTPILGVTEYVFSTKLSADGVFDDWAFANYEDGTLAILPERSREVWLSGADVDYFVCTKQPDGESSSTAKGNLQTGWVSNDGKWYYYENGTMVKEEWLYINQKWYYVLEDGSMVENSWKQIDGKSYYFGSDGAMYVNATTPDGKLVGDDGTEVQNKNIILTEKQESVIKTVLAAEITLHDGSFDSSDFNKEYVRDRLYIYAFGNYQNEDILKKIQDQQAMHGYYYDRNAANNALKSIYGIDPAFKNGDNFNDVITITNDKVILKMDLDGEPTGETTITSYSFDNGFLTVNGGFQVIDRTLGPDIYWTYSAKFKQNSESIFGFTLVSCNVTK